MVISWAKLWENHGKNGDFMGKTMGNHGKVVISWAKPWENHGKNGDFLLDIHGYEWNVMG